MIRQRVNEGIMHLHALSPSLPLFVWDAYSCRAARGLGRQDDASVQTRRHTVRSDRYLNVRVIINIKAI
jgi:hypothetical protein